MSEDWFWEGNIVQCICSYLGEQGWNIDKVADTAKRERGHDIRASKGNNTMLVEVKGFPSTLYARGDKMGQPKKTNVSTQARHWYAQALLSAVLTQSDNPNAISAIALPDFSTYSRLIRRTQHVFTKLGIVLYVVTEAGVVKKAH